MSIDKLFILGAGASFSATRPESVGLNEMDASNYDLPADQMPLDKNFNRVLSGMEKTEPSAWVQKALLLLKDNWKAPVPWESMGLEQAIQYQAANMGFVRRIVGNQILYSADFDDYLNNLVHLIALRLRKSQGAMTRSPEAPLIYELFAFKYFRDAKTANRIITFNYDDSLDEYLLGYHRYDVKKVYFSDLKSHKGELPTKRNDKSKPLLLKLHGSVNWNCNTTRYRKVFQEVVTESSRTDRFNLNNIWYRENGTPEVGDPDSPCLIPPIAFKPVAHVQPFKHLWKIASQYLNECKELYVCGYSLPHTDPMATALFGNVRNPHLEKIVVVDREAAVIDRLTKVIQEENVPGAEWSYRKDFGEFVRKDN